MTEKQELIKNNNNKQKTNSKPGSNPSRSAGTANSRHRVIRFTDDELAAVHQAQKILTRIFNVIYYSILNNETNQMYVADFMPVLLAHLNAQPLAGKCVTEMLSKNMDLQETKIGTN